MKKPRRLALKFTLAALVIMSLASFSLVSKTKLYKPTGKYKTGTFGVELTDKTRSEKDQSPRRLLVQFWYPANPTPQNVKAVYHPHPEQFNEDIQTLYGIPSLLTSKLSKAETNSYTDAPVSDAQPTYPVLIFSHGMNGSRFQNTFQMEELASQGYVVVSIEHPYTASGTVFSDGSRGSTIPFKKMQNFAYADSLITRWSDDQIFVLDYLEGLSQADAAGKLAAHLDMDLLGMFGHSFGGATTAATLTRDNRVKAGINLDGFYFGQYYKAGFTQPFMELRSENKPAEEMTEKELQEWEMSRDHYRYLLFDGWQERIRSYAKGGFETHTIAGANHMSFSDFTLVTPLKWLLAKDAEKHHRLTNDYTLNFFNKHLKVQE